MEDYIHAIGEVNEITTYEKLTSILKLGNICSRKKLDELGIKHSGANDYGLQIPKGKEYLYYEEDIHYDIVSLHDPNHHLMQRIIAKNRAFGCFRPTKIALAVSREIPILQSNETKGIDIGEVQVKDAISTEYITGIIVPNNEFISSELEQILCDKLRQICEDNNLYLPIYDYQGNILYEPEQKKM